MKVAKFTVPPLSSMKTAHARFMAVLLFLLASAVLAGCGNSSTTDNNQPVSTRANADAETGTDGTPDEVAVEERETGTACSDPLPDDGSWTPQELWAWNERLCFGLEANMAEYPVPDKQQEATRRPQGETEKQEGKDCDVAEYEKWPKHQELSAKFVHFILSVHTDKERHESDYIRISCAKIQNELEIIRSHPIRYIELKKSYIDSIYIENARMKGLFVDKIISNIITAKNHVYIESLEITNSNIDRIDFFRQRIGQARLSNLDLLPEEAGKIIGIDFSTAEIENRIEIEGRIVNDIAFIESKVKGGLYAKNAQIYGGLILNRSEMDFVYISGAYISDGIYMEGISISNILEMEELDTIYVNLKDARIDGHINARGVWVHSFTAAEATVKESVRLDEGVFQGKVDFFGTRIGGNLQVQNAQVFGPFMADSVEVGRYLHLRDSFFSSRVNLLNASAGKSITLNGSTVCGEINLSGSDVGKSMHMFDALFASHVNLKNAKISDNMDIRRSTVKGNIVINGAHVGNDIIMNGGRFSGEIYLRDVSLGGNLQIMDGVEVQKAILANRIHVGKSVFFRASYDWKDKTDKKSIFHGKIVFLNAYIENQLDFTNSEFMGRIFAQDIYVKHIILARNAIFHKPLQLWRSDVGQLYFKDAVLHDNLELSGARIRDSVFLNGAQFKSLQLHSAEVSRSLLLHGAEIAGGVLLPNATIRKELVLYRKRDGKALRPRWKKGSSFILRNAKVRSIVDDEQSWYLDEPARKEGKRRFVPTDLSNFTYEEFGSSSTTHVGERSLDWMLGWLRSQKDYDKRYIPQPFQQLAQELRSNGYDSKARAILIAQKDRLRAQDGLPWLQWIWLWIFGTVLGYGYNVWAAIFLFFGIALALALPGHVYHGFMRQFWYAVDVLTPGIDLKLDDHPICSQPTSPLSLWLPLLRIIGIAILTLLAAVLSGLIK